MRRSHRQAERMRVEPTDRPKTIVDRAFAMGSLEGSKHVGLSCLNPSGGGRFDPISKVKALFSVHGADRRTCLPSLPLTWTYFG